MTDLLKLSLQKELEELEKEEQIFDRKISQFLEESDDKNPFGLKTLQKLLAETFGEAPDFDAIANACASLETQISESNKIAEKVSGSVRELDLQRSRAQHALTIVEEAKELSNCLKGLKEVMVQDDLTKAVHHIRRFHQLDLSILQGSPEFEEMSTLKGNLKNVVFERFEKAILSNELESMKKTCHLIGPLDLASESNGLYQSYAAEWLEKRLEEIDESNAKHNVQNLSTLYNICAAFVQEQMPLATSGFSSSCGDIELLQKVYFEGGARAANLMRNYLAETQTKKRISEINAMMMREFANNGFGLARPQDNTPQKTTAFSSEISMEMDRSLDDLAQLLQYTETYDRFMRHIAQNLGNDHPSKADSSKKEAFPGVPGVFEGTILPDRTSVEEAAGEVSALYAEMEGALFKISVHKALLIDKVLPQSNTSSCVEDTFFIAHRCAKRAFATGHYLAASAVLNHISNVLSNEFMDVLSGKLKANLMSFPGPGTAGAGLDIALQKIGQLKDIDFKDLSTLKDQFQDNLQEFGQGFASDFSALGLGSKEGKGGSSSAVGGLANGVNEIESLVYLNDLESAIKCVGELGDELANEIPETFQEGHGISLTTASLGNFKACSEVFEERLSAGLEEVAARLMPAVRKAVSELLGEKSQVSYRLNETQYEQMEGCLTWAQALAMRMNALFAAYEPPRGLSLESFGRLLGLGCECVANRIEDAIKGEKFTQLGGLQLEKDVRTLSSFAVGKAGPGLRLPFTRLQQVALLLSLDSVEDAREFWKESGSNSRMLKLKDAQSFLALREDFAISRIESLLLA